MKDLENQIKLINSIFNLNRIRILGHMQSGEACVCEMVKDLKIKHNLLSHHLNVLSDHEFVSSRREGRHIKYYIQPEREKCVDNIMKLLNFKNCK